MTPQAGCLPEPTDTVLAPHIPRRPQLREPACYRPPGIAQRASEIRPRDIGMPPSAGLCHKEHRQCHSGPPQALIAGGSGCHGRGVLAALAGRGTAAAPYSGLTPHSGLPERKGNGGGKAGFERGERGCDAWIQHGVVATGGPSGTPRREAFFA
jgi:hypothetical protein